MNATADRTESLFAAAVALATPEERAAYLDQACAGDPALRAGVEALLRAHDRAGHLLDRPVLDAGQTGAYQPPSELPGTIIAGRYKLLEEIGEGGMGTVWVAEQTAPVRRKVALKLVKPGLDSRSVLARFEAERQALALMDHPNIAKVLDGGLTDAGRPFFVMEYVKGVPITEYCDATRLSVSERLQLFVQVCQAVQHAHQKGIIHRDLKPSNILVAPYDDRPVPKVIDFGLAKAMHQSLTERTLHTAHEMVVGTPLYMSPEQAQLNNLDVDTRSDIYSLGVLLYELLTGTTPLEKRRFKEAAWDEVRRIIREEEPPRPSKRLSTTKTLPSLAACRHTEPASLTKLVRGELDWIVMKALEKDRMRRYETANGFAMDIQRYLAGEPVLAVPPSTSYRLRKFARKHRATFATATAFAVLLVVGTLVSAGLAVRATRAEAQAKAERDAAQAAREQADKNFTLATDAVEKYLSKVTDNPKLLQADFNQLRKELLETAVPFYQQFAEQESQDPDLRAARARAYSRLARLRRIMGDQEIGRGDYRRALEIWEPLVAELPDRPQYREALAQTHNNFGNLLDDLGDRAEAAAHSRKAIAIQEQLAVDFPDRPQYRQSLANSHNTLGVILMATGQRDEAEVQYRKTLAIREELVADFPTVAEYHRNAAGSMNNLANDLRNLGRRAESLPLYERAIHHQKLALELNPKGATSSTFLAYHHHNLGILLAELGRRDEAEAHLRNALALRDKLVVAFPSEPRHVVDRAEDYMKFGHVVRDNGRPQESLDWYARAITDLEPFRVKETQLAKVRNVLREAHLGRAWVLDRHGRHAEAILEWEQALALGERENGPILRLGRAISRAYVSGDHRSALAEAEALAKNGDVSTLERLACLCAMASATVGSGERPAPDLQEQYAARAVALLRQAVGQGYRDSLFLKEGTDLAPLRNRADFADLLRNVAERSKK